MRLTTVSIAAALLLTGSLANAAPSKGGLGPGSASGSGAGSDSPGEPGALTRDVTRDHATNPNGPKKSWEVGLTFETHRLIRQEDLNGAGEDKTFNDVDAHVFYDITKNDRITLRGGFYERFIADPSESGFRLDDTRLAYTHFVPLPKDFLFRVTGRVTAPTSFDSQKMGLITEPRLTFQLDKALGYFNFEVLTFGTVYVQRFRESEGDGTPGSGGSANPKYSAGGLIEAEFRMPFLEDLSIGIDAYTQYTWLYDVQNGATAGQQGTCASCPGHFYGAIADQPNQPIQQEYGGEIFLHYYLPAIADVKSDLALALAQGDPALGYSSVLHDGVQHVYGLFRQTAEVYVALSVRY